MRKLFALALGMLVLTTAVQAEVDPAVEQRVRDALGALLPDMRPDSVRDTPIENLYEVTFGTRLVYITGDGRFIVQGKLVDLQTREAITEQRMSELKLAALAEVGEERMVIYGADDARHTVTVFTDIDCGFCRRLHAEMKQYNDAGIRIRYLFYPRAGIGSDSYDKAVAVWCADDRRAAMDAAKAGEAVPVKRCDNPVAEHHALGQAIGLQGTPALLLEDGEMVPGYIPAGRLRTMLEQRRSASGG